MPSTYEQLSNLKDPVDEYALQERHPKQQTENVPLQYQSISRFCVMLFNFALRNNNYIITYVK